MGQDAVDLVQLLGTIQGENLTKLSIPTTKLTSDSQHYGYGRPTIAISSSLLGPYVPSTRPRFRTIPQRGHAAFDGACRC